MNYDIAIATRNRPEALQLSIPLFLNQSEMPNSLVVIDSSDDHQQVRDTIDSVVGQSTIPITLRHSAPGSALQRNIALEYVKSPIVMFPDDDSLWWPDVARSIMEIYRSDTEQQIGGICGRETSEVPPGVSPAGNDAPYKMKVTDVIRQKIAKRRHAVEKHLMPDPLWVVGRSYWKDKQQPDFLDQFDTALVEFMGGFRMTFRTDEIKKNGFDEDLGAFIGYSAYEDADASFNILKDNKFLVGAHQAHVYHYKSPNLRAGGFALGFILLFNRAYIICKYSLPGSEIRKIIRKFAYYKILQYFLGCSSQFGRDRVYGSFCALRNIDKLLSASGTKLRETYLNVCRQVLEDNEI